MWRIRFWTAKQQVGSDKVLYSWKLAKVLDDAVFAASGEHQTRDPLDGLSC
jgi:hypothetical protein